MTRRPLVDWPAVPRSAVAAVLAGLERTQADASPAVLARLRRVALSAFTRPGAAAPPQPGADDEQAEPHR